MISAFDDVVANMMQEYGTTAHIVVTTAEEYSPDTSENETKEVEYRVRAMFFDYIDKMAGKGTERNSLIQSGDKQVYIQPPHKTSAGIPLPHIDTNKDRLKVNGTTYKIVTIKQYNPSMSRAGCVLYEAYIRE